MSDPKNQRAGPRGIRKIIATSRSLVLKAFGGMLSRSGSSDFRGSAAYWEDRYDAGGDSGVGSYDKFANFKARALNQFVVAHEVKSVIEYGCGDGNQLMLARYPQYLGFDVSTAAIRRCRTLFKSDTTKAFCLMQEYKGETADLTLSLDVIYHLIEDDVYKAYMRRLFESSTKFVAIYASNSDDNSSIDAPHVRHRQFTSWIDASGIKARLIDHVPNEFPYAGDFRVGSWSDFYFFEKI